MKVSVFRSISGSGSHVSVLSRQLQNAGWKFAESQVRVGRFGCKVRYHPMVSLVFDEYPEVIVPNVGRPPKQCSTSEVVPDSHPVWHTCEILVFGFLFSLTLSITGSHNIAEIESLLTRLPSSRADCDLLIPTHLRKRQFGGVSALIQFLVTWARAFPNGRVVLHASDEVETAQQLPAFSNQDHGSVALLCGGDIVTRTKGISIKRQAHEFARRRILQMHEANSVEESTGPLQFAAQVGEVRYFFYSRMITRNWHTCQLSITKLTSQRRN